MRILFLLVALIVLTSFKEPESCEQFYQKGTYSHLTIFPICGDSSLYIVRIFNRKGCEETIYKDKKKCSSVTLIFPSASNKEKTLWDNYNLEMFYQNEAPTEMRSYDQIPKMPMTKNFLVDSSLFFKVNYYPNGFIKNYSLIKEACPVSNGAELDSMNTFIWRGRYDGPSSKDTSDDLNKETNKIEPVFIHYCNYKTGIWTKTDFSGKVLEAINNPGYAQH